MSFLKIAIKNFLKGPVTDPYPFGKTFIPEKLRGKLKVDASICTACGTCQEVCPSSAIKITKNKNAFIHTTWYNTCCFCGNCEYFCPTGAIKLTNDFHTVNTKEEKYKFVNIAVIAQKECSICGKKFVPATAPLIQKSFPRVNKEIAKLIAVCPECRKKLAFERLYQ